MSTRYKQREAVDSELAYTSCIHSSFFHLVSRTAHVGRPRQILPLVKFLSRVFFLVNLSRNSSLVFSSQNGQQAIMTKHLIYRASSAFPSPHCPTLPCPNLSLSIASVNTRPKMLEDYKPHPSLPVPPTPLFASRFPFALTFKCCFVFIATPPRPIPAQQTLVVYL